MGRFLELQSTKTTTKEVEAKLDDFTPIGTHPKSQVELDIKDMGGTPKIGVGPQNGW